MRWRPREVCWAGLLFAACAHAPDVPEDWHRPRQADIALQMERLGCWGHCPSYRVVVHRDGLVEYAGWDNVGVAGRAMRRVPLETVLHVVERAEAAGFFAEPDHTAGGTRETVRLYIDSRTGPHAIEHNHGDPGAPEWLGELEEEIDRSLGTSDWVHPAALRTGTP